MIELESVRRMQSLKTAIEGKTGAEYNDLTEAVQDLVNPNHGKEVAKLITADGAEYIYGSVSDALAATHTKPVIYVLYGKSTQDGEPTPDNPVEIVNGFQTIGGTGDLRGIPVDSGGNYTDANGQQWVCDEIDFVRGVKVQRTKTIELDGKTTGCLATSKSTVNTKTNAFLIKTVLWKRKVNSVTKVFVSHYKFTGTSSGSGDVENQCATICNTYIDNEEGALYIGDERYKTIATYNAYLAEQYEARTPVTVVYELSTPIETALTADELAAYRALLPETVQMIADSTEGNVIVPGGVTVDLNGCVLTADKFVSFGNVVDDSADNTALLKVPRDNVKLAVDNTQIPLLSDNGYVFLSLDIKTQLTVTDGKGSFRFYIDKTKDWEEFYNYLADNGASDHGLSIDVNSKWDVTNGIAQYDLSYTDDFMAYASSMQLEGKFAVLTYTWDRSSEKVYTLYAVIKSKTGAEFRTAGDTT